MSKEQLHTLFARVPKELWEALRKEAKEQQRSATAQIIHILRDRYRQQENRTK